MLQAALLTGTAPNQVNGDAEVPANHNVYTVTTLETQGFGQWCGACHSNPDDGGTGFHGSAKTDTDVGTGATTGDWIRHPTAKKLLAEMATNYGTVYDPTVPLEVTAASALTSTNSSAITLLDLANTSQASCLSCHKAHASANTDATRWNMSLPSGVNAKCNKCHGIGD